MRIGTCIDQLHVHPNFVASLLHATFEHSGDAKLASYGLQVFWFAFVFRYGRARDNLEVTDASELRQDFVLNTVGEVRVCFFFAQIFKRQHGNALVGN